MLCHRKASLCGSKTSAFDEGHDSEGEDMYGFLPKKGLQPPTSVRPRENIYSETPRRRPARKVTFQEDLPKVNRVQRRHSCADSLRTYATRKYNYPPLIPMENLPTYPNVVSALRRSASFIEPNRCAHRRVQMPAPLAAAVAAAVTASNRPPPPSYHVAVRRAASFSAARGVSRGLTTRRPGVPQQQIPNPNRTSQSAAKARVFLNKPLSSSTSELYVDAAILKHQNRPDLSTASSKSSVSEATVYKQIGPSDYISIDDKQPQRRRFRSSIESTSDDGVDVSFRSSVASSTDLERTEQHGRSDIFSKYHQNGTVNFPTPNAEDSQDGELDAVLDELSALKSKLADITVPTLCPNTDGAVKTDSTDNDSAYSDSASLFSNDCSTCSNDQSQLPPRPEDKKIEKTKTTHQPANGGGRGADAKQFFVTVLTKDGDGEKSVVVDETMNCGLVNKMLADKNGVALTPKWALVEKLPDLCMERAYEEHELLVQNVMLWTRDTKNKLYFEERPERQMVFQSPHIFYPEFKFTNTIHQPQTFYDALIEKYFNHDSSPILQSSLHIKGESKKEWKKYRVVLKNNAIYYCKEKLSKSPKQLKCLATLEANQVYYGVDWKKKLKAPTEHCFAIKHTCVQYPKSSKYIKYLSAEDDLTLQKWITAIRIVKYGHQLLENYLSQLPNEEAGSCDSNSSGCDAASESEFTGGSMKRSKPAKLPLTNTTRQLASLDDRSDLLSASPLENPICLASLPPPPPEFLDSAPRVHEQGGHCDDFPPPLPPPRLPEPQSPAVLDRLQKTTTSMRSNWPMVSGTGAERRRVAFGNCENYRENDVNSWISEHYGRDYEISLYENVNGRGGGGGGGGGETGKPMPTRVSLPVPLKSPSSSSTDDVNSSALTTIKKRSPPPPPPPRAKTTQLTRR